MSIININGKIDVTQYQPDGLTSLELLVLMGLVFLQSDLSAKIIGTREQSVAFGVSTPAILEKLKGAVPAPDTVIQAWDKSSTAEHASLTEYLNYLKNNYLALYHLQGLLATAAPYGSCKLQGVDILKLLAAAHEISKQRL